jgi:hypothetical protein
MECRGCQGLPASVVVFAGIPTAVSPWTNTDRRRVLCMVWVTHAYVLLLVCF